MNLRAFAKRVVPRPVRRAIRRIFPPPGPVPEPAPEGAPPPPEPAPSLRRIDNLAELDAALAKAEALFAKSEDEALGFLNSFEYEYPAPLPVDPRSDEYRAVQMQIYSHVSGRAGYDAKSCEHSAFDLESARAKPYPYLTGSMEAVGTQLIKQGLIIRHLPVRPPARVVEFGPGWGNLTLQLALAGYAVTAVEIEPAFGELIRHRAGRLSVEVEVIEQDMLAFRAEAPYDDAIFFESFHHCPDHLRLLSNLSDVVKPGGVVLFGTEPLDDYPHPWGVRLNGLSVWSMRRHGWLELGFDTTYFLRTLGELGWHSERHRLPECPGADVIVARRARVRE